MAAAAADPRVQVRFLPCVVPGCKRRISLQIHQRCAGYCAVCGKIGNLRRCALGLDDESPASDAIEMILDGLIVLAEGTLVDEALESGRFGIHLTDRSALLVQSAAAGPAAVQQRVIPFCSLCGREWDGRWPDCSEEFRLDCLTNSSAAREAERLHWRHINREGGQGAAAPQNPPQNTGGAAGAVGAGATMTGPAAGS